MQSPPSAAEVLYETGFRYVSLANNHSMEFGSAKYRDTVEILKDNGVTAFGHKECPFTIARVGSRRLGLFAFSTIPALYGHEPEYFFLDFKSRKSMAKLHRTLQEARNSCDILVVMPHWGFEFVTEPAEHQIRLAEELLTEGADVVAGAHPHVIQSRMVARGRSVYFSLGNFICDYPQRRLRESVLLVVDVNQLNPVCEFRLISDEAHRVSFLESVEPVPETSPVLPGDGKYRAWVDYERKLVRKEMLLHLMRNAHHVLANPGLVCWLLRRAFFLAKSRHDVSTDPYRIYSGPLH